MMMMMAMAMAMMMIVEVVAGVIPSMVEFQTEGQGRYLR